MILCFCVTWAGKYIVLRDRERLPAVPLLVGSLGCDAFGLLMFVASFAAQRKESNLLVAAATLAIMVGTATFSEFLCQVARRLRLDTSALLFRIVAACIVATGALVVYVTVTAAANPKQAASIAPFATAAGIVGAVAGLLYLSAIVILRQGRDPAK